MEAYRTEDLAHGDHTSWIYDEVTGLLLRKLYADDKGPTYDYTSEGRLARRTWARGVATDYAYDSQGRLVSKTYSDSTPDVSLTYDRLGNILSAVCDGVSTNLYAYSRLGQLTNEVQNGTTIARSYDALGRATGYTLGGEGSSPADVGTEVEYGYDSLGRFASVTSGDEVFTYGYVPGSSLVGSVANNHGLVRTTTYEPHRNLIATVENAHSNNVISRFDYANDAIGRRTAITRTGSAFSSLSGSIDHYGYNDRSEVISAHRTLNGEEVRGFSFGYAYDPIGNRTSSTEWDENGVAHTSHYTANELNEYESRTVPGHVTVLGEAATDATVTVNGNPAWRKGAYFAGGDSFDNTSSDVFAELATTAVRSTGETDEVESTTGHKFLSQSPETFTYDEDGNMTSDGRFIYTWDAENRLTGVETRNDFGMDIPHVRVENGYDHQFRRACKRVWTNSVLDKQTVFIYDDWNMIVENASSTTHHDVNIYMWGLDITGSRKSAGGVGGLLARFNDCSDMIPLYDGNGNISEWIIDGIETNHAEYSPFGGFVVGSNPRESTFAFSTKYYDKEMDLYSFPFRYFSPSSGRWLSRDVVGEEGGASLFSFVANSPITYFDPFGQKFWSWETLGDALDIVGGGAMIVAGVAVGTAASWTGFGAVAGGLLVAYGGDTLLKGSTSLGNRLAGGNGFDETPVQWSYHYVAEQITGETESGLSITLDCFYFAGEFATTCFSGYEYYKSIRLTIRQLGPIKKVPELYVNESGFLRQIEYLEGGGFIRDYLGGMIYHTFGELRDVITVGEDFYDLITIDGVSTPIDDQGSSTNNQPNPEPEF